MRKMFVAVIPLLLFTVVASSHEPAPPAPKKFDWKKAKGEREEMRNRMREEHKKYIAKLNDFYKRYSEAKDDAARDAVRTELNAFLTVEFQRKIEFSKKRIEGMKKFVARLEADQQRMEQNAAEIVKKRSDEILKGKITPPRRKR